jgi:hypothetical protein
MPQKTDCKLPKGQMDTTSNFCRKKKKDEKSAQPGRGGDEKKPTSKILVGEGLLIDGIAKP